MLHTGFGSAECAVMPATGCKSVHTRLVSCSDRRDQHTRVVGKTPTVRALRLPEKSALKSPARRPAAARGFSELPYCDILTAAVVIGLCLKRLSAVGSYDIGQPDGLGTTINELPNNFLANPDAFASRPSVQAAPGKVFVSYSQSDREFMKRLMIHLRPLEKGCLIDTCVDTRLQVGDRWREAIEEAPLRARVAMCIVRIIRTKQLFC